MMGKKYKKAILFIVVFLGLSFILVYSYKKYTNSYSEGAIVTKLANLSVNYIDGNVVKSTDKEKILHFSVTNDSQIDVYYSVRLVNVKQFATDVKLYLYNNSNNSLEIKTNGTNDVIVSNGVKVSPKETQSYYIKITNPNEEFNIFELEVSEDKEQDITITKTIINNNIIKSAPATKVGEEAATNDEGLISDLDDYGVTYYFRGNVTNNYFNFAEKRWRIVRINGDNTIRLILDEQVSTMEQFAGEEGEYNSVAISKSLDEWYNSNLSNYDKYIVENKFCYDYNLSTDKTVYNAYTRVVVSNTPSFNCEGKVISKNIGLLSVDEAIYAGLMVNRSNTSNYLYNSGLNEWWTITPSTNEYGFNIFIVKNDGAITSVNSRNVKSLRPVINLSSYIHIEGNGTKENPYKIIE